MFPCTKKCIFSSNSVNWWAPWPTVGLWGLARKANFGEKMYANNDRFRSFWVPRFAQMLKKNLPVKPSAQMVTTPIAHSSELTACQVSKLPKGRVIFQNHCFPKVSSISYPVLPQKINKNLKRNKKPLRTLNELQTLWDKSCVKPFTSLHKWSGFSLTFRKP